MADQDDVVEWMIVPRRVALDYEALIKDASAVRALYDGVNRSVYWAPSTGRSALDVPPDENYILVKAADYDFLRKPAELAIGAQKPFGGPNALTSAILGGAIGSGLGYIGGTAAEHVLPEEQFRRGKLRKTLALMGGLAGAVPAAALGHVFKRADIDEMAEKAASAAGSYYQPTIPVDAFNRAVWSDVVGRPTPYGTKSSWGDDSQPLATPAWAAAAASGLVSGTSAATGSAAISPFQLATTAATTAGAGYLAAAAFGKTIGALAGLRPEAQSQLQNAGLWGGLVTGAVRGLFGGR